MSGRQQNKAVSEHLVPREVADTTHHISYTYTPHTSQSYATHNTQHTTHTTHQTPHIHHIIHIYASHITDHTNRTPHTTYTPHTSHTRHHIYTTPHTASYTCTPYTPHHTHIRHTRHLYGVRGSNSSIKLSTDAKANGSRKSFADSLHVWFLLKSSVSRAGLTSWISRDW